MQIYIFRSQTKRELRAFTGEASGSTLPQQFAPWHATGIVKSGNEPPHNFARGAIEEAISNQGFQLWRMKLAEKPD